MKASYWITLSLVSLLVIFIVQNAAATSIKFLFWNIEISMALLLFFIFLIGFIIGMLWFSKKNKEQQTKTTADVPVKYDAESQPSDSEKNNQIEKQ